MQKETKPKSLQREHPEKALEYYLEQYKECLAEGDDFLSGLYLDEVVESMLLCFRGEKMSHDMLSHELNSLVRGFNLDSEAEERAALDINIALRKRFSEEYKQAESGDLDDASP